MSIDGIANLSVTGGPVVPYTIGTDGVLTMTFPADYPPGAYTVVDSFVGGISVKFTVTRDGRCTADQSAAPPAQSQGDTRGQSAITKPERGAVMRNVTAKYKFLLRRWQLGSTRMMAV